MNKMLIAALMLFTVNATASIKDDALLILERAGLGLSIDKPNGCAVAEIGEPTRHIKISCMAYAESDIEKAIKEMTERAKKLFKAAGYTVEKSGLGFVVKQETRE